jgi:hypothetical protein
MNNFQSDYRHPLWQKKRLEILQLKSFACEVCADENSELNVHHKRYIKGNKPWEYEDNIFMVLCKRCHTYTHAQMNTAKEIVSEVPIGRLFGLNTILYRIYCIEDDELFNQALINIVNYIDDITGVENTQPILKPWAKNEPFVL